MPASPILLFAVDEAEAERLATSLRAAGHAVSTATDAATFLASAAGHQLLVVDVTGDGAEAAAVVRDVRAGRATAALPVLCFAQTSDVEERVRLLEAGADDVVTRPFDARELEARVETLLLRFQRAGGSVPAPLAPAPTVRPHTVVSIFGAKGGAGTTTIAVNLALALAERQPGQVALVDLALPLGQVTAHLDLKPRGAFAELLQPDAGPDAVRAAAERYAGTLDVFCPPEDAEEADRLTAAQLLHVLDLLNGEYLFVILDAGATLSARALALLEASDRIVLVTLPEIPALRALVAVEQVLGERRVAERSLHVVNHLFAHEPLKRSDIEETLGTSIVLELPHDDLLFAKAVNEGVPVVRAAPRSMPSERLAHLASVVAGAAQPQEAVETPKRRFSLLRRGH